MWPWLPYGALALAVALAWGGSLDASFQFDDWHVIVDQPRVQSLLAWWHALPGMRPLLKFSYALNHSLGFGVRGFRLCNIFIHACNAMLVYALFCRRTEALKWPAPGARFAALCIALLFALEPVQTEAVTYISGRSSALAALGCLLALACWQTARSREQGIGAHLLGIVCYVGAIAVKETALVLPLALWLWESTWPGEPRWRRQERRAFAAFAAVALLGAAVVLALPGYRALIASGLASRSIASNLLTQAQAWGWLLLQLVLPGRLNADPHLPVVTAAQGPALLWAIFWAIFWVLLAIGTLWRMRRNQQLAFGLLWFYIWLLPTNSLIPRADVVNDRQLYLSLLGPAWLLVYALARHYQRLPATCWAILSALVLLLGHAVILRNHVYRTEISFWEDIATRDPANARAANNLGMAYALQCRAADAAAQFERAATLDRAAFRPRVNLKLLRAGALVPHCRGQP